MHTDCTTVEIPLTKGKVAIVDAADVEWLSQWKWHSVGSYAGTKDGRKTMYMHRLITGAKPGEVVDHIDRNPLNNTRANLRIGTYRQNKINQKLEARNTSGFRGVHWHKQMEKWRAVINVDGKNKHLGLFVDKEEAAKAYDAAAKQYHGEYAQLNFG